MSVEASASPRRAGHRSSPVGAALVGLVVLATVLGSAAVLARQVPHLVAGRDDVTPWDVVAAVAAGLSVLAVVVGVAVAAGSRNRPTHEAPPRLAGAGLRRTVRLRRAVLPAEVPAARGVAEALARRRLASWPLAGVPLLGVALLAEASGPLGVVGGAALVVGGGAAALLLAADGARGRAFLAAHPEPEVTRSWLAGRPGSEAEREASATALRRRWLAVAALLVLVAPAVLVPLVPRAPDVLAPPPPATWRAVSAATLGVLGALLLVLGGVAAWRDGQVDRWLRSPVWGMPAHQRRRTVLRLRGLEPTPEAALPQVRSLAAHLAHQRPTFVLLAGLSVTLLGRGLGSPSTTALVLSLVAVATVLGLLLALARAWARARRFLRDHPFSSDTSGGAPRSS